MQFIKQRIVWNVTPLFKQLCNLFLNRRQLLIATITHTAVPNQRIAHVREYNEIFKDAEKDGDISEDELRRLAVQVQDSTDKYVKEIDELIALKESEVLEV